MGNITICVVDDNPIALKSISQILWSQEQYDVSLFDNIADTRIYKEMFDIYLLDIDMNGKKTGFYLAEHIHNLYPTAIFVFVSNHEQLVYESFHFHASFFVRKKEMKTELLKAVQKIEDTLYNKEQGYVYEYRSDFKIIPYKNIVHFSKDRNVLFIHCIDGSSFHQQKTISSVMKDISDNHQTFCLVNPAEIVNLMHIKAYEKGIITCANEVTIEVSRRRRKQFQIMYKEFLHQ